MKDPRRFIFDKAGLQRHLAANDEEDVALLVTRQGGKMYLHAAGNGDCDLATVCCGLLAWASHLILCCAEDSGHTDDCV